MCELFDVFDVHIHVSDSVEVEFLRKMRVALFTIMYMLYLRKTYDIYDNVCVKQAEIALFTINLQSLVDK
jgi:hypothetical protein